MVKWATKCILDQINSLSSQTLEMVGISGMHSLHAHQDQQKLKRSRMVIPCTFKIFLRDGLKRYITSYERLKIMKLNSVTFTTVRQVHLNLGRKKTLLYLVMAFMR